MSVIQRHCLVSIALAAFFTGCSTNRFEPAPPLPPGDAGTRIPSASPAPATKIIFAPANCYGHTFQLGPQATGLFLAMLEKTPVSSKISLMEAAPMGTFTVGDKDYLWHGNAVIRGHPPNEHLWSGPYLQRLVRDVLKGPADTPEDYVLILSVMEADLNLASTPMEGPGAYPGGGDALHPIIVPAP